MNGNLFLPDTSAILTMMDNEGGADVVEGILRTREILLPGLREFGNEQLDNLQYTSYSYVYAI